MFNYEFMRTAFFVGLMLAIIIPLIGTNLVFKRLSMTGDALSHTSLAGVAIGLIAGFNPVITAMIISVISALIVELIRKKFNKYSELSLSIVLSAGIGITALLSSFTSVANMSSYLFGSMVAITKSEVIMTVILFVCVILFSLLFYKEIMFISFNEKSARISKVPVNFINITQTVLSALTISVATKTIGALLVSSLIVIPVAASLQLSKSYKSTIIYAVVISITSVICGIITSFYLDLKPGGTIVIYSLIILIITMLINPVKKVIYKSKMKSSKVEPEDKLKT